VDAFADFPIMLYTPDETSPYEFTSPTFFNVPGLHNALGAVGFSSVRTISTFAPYAFDLARHFPRLAAENPGYATVDTKRSITIASNRREATFLDDYFEGTHEYHSTNLG
jgi:hypothetical protein